MFTLTFPSVTSYDVPLTISVIFDVAFVPIETVISLSLSALFPSTVIVSLSSLLTYPMIASSFTSIGSTEPVRRAEY